MRSVLVLGIICLVSGALLAWVNGLTSEQIKIANSKAKLDAAKEVFSEGASEVKLVVKDDKTFFELYDEQNNMIGVAIPSSSLQGYGGEISIILGVDSACKVSDYRVLSHKETPGLGDKMTEDFFREQFQGKSLGGTSWQVRKDGGDFDALTAATITSRAVVEAVESGLKLFSEYYGQEKGCK